ncbi:MAG: hypothetical protein ACRDRL_13165 [Sciscionella sp.]
MGWGSGQVVQVPRKRGPVWYARYREPSGRQREKMIGRVWTGSGRPPEGYLTKRGAEDWLREKLAEDARRDAIGPLGTNAGTTFAEAAGENLRYAEQDRGCKPSTRCATPSPTATSKAGPTG